MQERLEIYPTPKTKNRRLLIQRLPKSIVVGQACHFLGKDLTKKEIVGLGTLVTKALDGKPIKASLEVPPVYESQISMMSCRGAENIPKRGATIVVANHPYGGPLRGLGQFFEIARLVHCQRTEVKDEFVREPYVIMQLGITSGNSATRFFTNQFRASFARSIGWEIVKTPKYDQNGQIANSQGLPKTARQRLFAGGAMIWFPQGKHRTDLEVPQKGGGFLFSLREKNVRLVPLRITAHGTGNLDFVFGESVHILELPVTNRTIDINQFVQNHIAPLGEKRTF